MSDPIRITNRDLHSSQVEEYVQHQSYLRRDVGEIDEQPWLIRVIYANWFYLSIAATIGGVIGWLILEPYYDDNRLGNEMEILDVIGFPIVTGMVGLFLGAAEGLICRNVQRAFICGFVGLGIGFVGGLIAFYPSKILYVIMAGLAFSFVDQPQLQDDLPTGMALLVLMMGRGAAWSLSGIPAGIGQGIAVKEKKVIINGLVGGMLGGLLGGMLFDPICHILLTDDKQAVASRGIGFASIGFFVGLFVGLVEGWTKTAWLLMKKGPLAGKQFIMFKDSTVLGSSPKADVYLFKDDAIEPKHALITNRGGRFEIEDCNTPDGTYVNGIPITRHVLQPGDQVVLGKTVLEFSVKESTS